MDRWSCPRKPTNPQSHRVSMVHRQNPTNPQSHRLSVLEAGSRHLSVVITSNPVGHSKVKVAELAENLRREMELCESVDDKLRESC